MNRKLILISALVLAFVSADATTRKTDRIQTVIRGEQNGPWKAYLFGASCRGTLEVKAPHDDTEPIEIVCK